MSEDTVRRPVRELEGAGGEWAESIRNEGLLTMCNVQLL